jgi:hypothetical protein
MLDGLWLTTTRHYRRCTAWTDDRYHDAAMTRDGNRHLRLEDLRENLVLRYGNWMSASFGCSFFIVAMALKQACGISLA